MEICLLYIGTSRSAKVTSKTVFKKKGAGAVRRTAVLAAGEHRRKSLLHTALPWGIPGGMSRRPLAAHSCSTCQAWSVCGICLALSWDETKDM